MDDEEIDRYWLGRERGLFEDEDDPEGARAREVLVFGCECGYEASRRFRYCPECGRCETCS